MMIVEDIVLRASLVLLWLGSLVSLLMGLGMLLKPERMERINSLLSRWISTEKFEAHLDRPRWTERFFYRHHRIVGAFILSGSVFILAMFFIKGREVESGMPRIDIPFFDAGAVLLLAGILFAMAIGGIMFLRPSLLKNLEKSANMWVGAESLHKFFNDAQHGFDRSALRHGRTVGFILTVASLYIFLSLAHFVFR